MLDAKRCCSSITTSPGCETAPFLNQGVCTDKQVDTVHEGFMEMNARLDLVTCQKPTVTVNRLKKLDGVVMLVSQYSVEMMVAESHYQRPSTGIKATRFAATNRPATDGSSVALYHIVANF